VVAIFSLQPPRAKTVAIVSAMKSPFRNLWLYRACFVESWMSNISPQWCAGAAKAEWIVVRQVAASAN
jgi:hypothetical protein